MFLMELEMVSEYSKYPREASLKVSSRSNIRKLVKSKSLPGVLGESNVLEGARDGVRALKISQGSFTESFIKIQQWEAYKDFTYHQSPLLESWRTWRFLMDLELV